MSSAKKPLILCVDDEPAVLQVQRDMLNRGGYDVITADSGGGGLATLQQAKPDLMLLGHPDAGHRWVPDVRPHATG